MFEILSNSFLLNLMKTNSKNLRIRLITYWIKLNLSIIENHLLSIMRTRIFTTFLSTLKAKSNKVNTFNFILVRNILKKLLSKYNVFRSLKTYRTKFIHPILFLLFLKLGKKWYIYKK